MHAEHMLWLMPLQHHSTPLLPAKQSGDETVLSRIVPMAHGPSVDMFGDEPARSAYVAWHGTG